MFKMLFLLLSWSLIESNPYSPYNSYEGVEGFETYANHLDFIAQFLPDDPVIFEAGGHYGMDSLRFVAKWPNATIFSFEPNPHAFQMFLENTSSIPHIHGYPLAVNDYNGEAVLYVCYGTKGDDPSYEGASSLLEASEQMKMHYQGPKVVVSCVVLDDWCRQKKIDHIDFMWLDLEGLELQVLKSSPAILDTVKVLFTETNFRTFRVGMTRYREMKRFLEKKGFKLLAHWYDEAVQGNAIFIRKEL